MACLRNCLKQTTQLSKSSSHPDPIQPAQRHIHHQHLDLNSSTIPQPIYSTLKFSLTPDITSIINLFLLVPVSASIFFFYGCSFLLGYFVGFQLDEQQEYLGRCSGGCRVSWLKSCRTMQRKSDASLIDLWTHCKIVMCLMKILTINYSNRKNQKNGKKRKNNLSPTGNSQ